MEGAGPAAESFLSQAAVPHVCPACGRPRRVLKDQLSCSKQKKLCKKGSAALPCRVVLPKNLAVRAFGACSGDGAMHWKKHAMAPWQGSGALAAVSVVASPELSWARGTHDARACASAVALRRRAGLQRVSKRKQH